MARTGLGNFMVVGNTNLKVQFEVSYIVTNLEYVNCTGLLQHSNHLLTHSFQCCNSFITNAR
jgi:hypothetical protein